MHPKAYPAAAATAVLTAWMTALALAVLGAHIGGPVLAAASTLGLMTVLLSPLALLTVACRHAWIHSTLSRARLNVHHQIEHARALQAPVPHTLTLTQRAERAGGIAKDVAEATAAFPTFARPSMAAVIDGVGEKAEDQMIRLGSNAETGEPVTGTWDSIYSAGINGLAGAGKTNTAAFYAAQGALVGVKLLVGDPHATKADSLARRLAPLAPAYLDTAGVDAEGIDRVIGKAISTLEARKAGDPDRTRVLLVLDEWTAIMRRSRDQAKNIASITSEGRNYGLFAMLLAQCWTAGASGGSEMRNTLSSCFVHRSQNRDALMLTGRRSSEIGKTSDLPDGQCLFFDSQGGLQTLMIPWVTMGEMADIGGRLAA